ncbi:shikimate O-hydroxycinnamoyltransferase, partial [Tanacetum coccineum]
VIDDVMRQLSFEETKLDGEACFADVVRSGVERSGLSHDESFGVDDLDLNLNEHVNLNVSQIKTQSEIHVSEEPYVGRTEEPIVAEVRTQEPFVEESSEDAGTDDDDDDDEDEDFIVDEENEIIDPDVDVHLFVINMDIPFDNIGITNLVPDDVLEREDVDVINADGFDTDPGNNDETKNYRRRRLAELSREMEDVMNAIGKWKYSFYTGQKFTTPKEAKDRVYLHSIESKRNLKLYKNDNVRIRARCDGKVHVFTMS